MTHDLVGHIKWWFIKVIEIIDTTLGMGPANEKRRYIVKPSLIGRAHTLDDPCPRDACKFVVNLLMAKFGLLLRCLQQQWWTKLVLLRFIFGVLIRETWQWAVGVSVQNLRKIEFPLIVRKHNYRIFNVSQFQQVYDFIHSWWNIFVEPDFICLAFC